VAGLSPVFHEGMAIQATVRDPQVGSPRPVHAQPGVRFALAVAALALAAVVVGLLGLAPAEVEWLLVGVGGLSVMGLAPLLAGSVGAMAWAFYTGFTEHDYGRLTLAGHDLDRLAVMAAATTVVAWWGAGLRHVLREIRHG
jgi:hypothetical protein